MSALKKLTSITTKITEDADGNRLLTESEETIKLKTEEDYIKIYIKHINYLNNLPSGLDPLIYSLLPYMNYGNQIVINSAIKKKIAEQLGKKFNTINQYVSKLVDHSILIREDTGIYYLNPEFYGRGSWKDIVKLRKNLEININYSEDGIKITHNKQSTYTQPKLKI
jgi:hypothetical protein